MNHFRPITSVIVSALKGAGITLATLLVLSIFALPMGGPLILLYYWAYIVFYILPIAMLFGALIGLVSLFTLRKTPKQKKRSDSNRTAISVVGIIIIFGLISSYIALPFFTLGQISYVHHGASWYYFDANVSCDIQIVMFRLEYYDDVNFICDQAVLDYLDTFEGETIRLTYQVTSDFGEPRSYQLISIGTIPVTWDTWIRGGRQCGGTYDHPCNSPQAQNSSSLKESSWSSE